MVIQPRLSPTSAKCPGCRATMHRLETPGVLVAPCMSCGGLWLDVLACKSVLVGTLSLECKAFIREHGTTNADAPTGTGYRAAATEIERACPVCQQSLRATTVPPHAATLDVCEHGTFFDRHELRAILDNIVAQREVDERDMDALGTKPWAARLHASLYRPK